MADGGQKGELEPQHPGAYEAYTRAWWGVCKEGGVLNRITDVPRAGMEKLAQDVRE